MRRRLLWPLGVGAVALLGLAAILFPLFVSTSSLVSRENFARIREGMTEAEVVAILGGPPNRWEDQDRLPEEDRINVANWDDPQLWIGDDCHIVVRFFDGRVTDKELHDRESAQDGLLGRLRRLFPW